MKLVQRDIPGRATTSGNAFEDTISTEMISLLKRSPGVQFQICEDDGKPRVMGKSQVNALRQACKRPYRLVTRTARGKKSERVVWISNDPGYWVRLDEKRRRKEVQA